MALAGGAILERQALTERQAYVVVGVAHLLLFGALSLALRAVTPPPPPTEGDPVEIVTAAEARAASRAVQPAPPPPAPPRPAPPSPAPPPPVPPPPTPAPAPKPTPAPPPPKPVPAPKITPPKPVDEAAEPAKVKPKSEKPKPEKPKPEKPKPEKPQPKPLDTDALSKLLAKATPKARPLDTKALAKSLDAAIPKAKPLDTAALAKSLDAALPKGPARAVRGDPRATALLAAAIRAQVLPCFTLPVGGDTRGKVTALLDISINRDGSIAGRPSIASQTGVTTANADYARAFAEAARRAVLRCSPLKLPPDQYDQWRAVEINFDPATF